VFDGFDWNTHPVLFAYAAVIAVLVWLVGRLLKLVERLVLDRRARAAEGTTPDQARQLEASMPDSDPPVE
jgi:hypothetical protein